MSDEAKQIRKLLRQQEAIARFGGFALREPDLHTILTEAARVCAIGLSVPFSKICRYREAENDLLIEAGVGWMWGVVGHVVSRADASSPQGLAFITGEPSISNDLRKETQFELPPFYEEHGIISTIDVLIKGSGDHPYGVLEIDSDTQQDFDQNDVVFLTGFANVLAEAVDTSERIILLETVVRELRDTVSEKNRLLDQKSILAQELQHRVRNNMQLVYGMLSRQLEDTADEAGRRGIRSIARRVTTLSQVYEQLIGTEMTRAIDFGAYAKALCLNIAEVQGSPGSAIEMICECQSIILDLDDVTVLGIVIAELVTNSYDHAFGDGRGTIWISVRQGKDASVGVITISDNGAGFRPVPGSKRHGLGLVRRLVEQANGLISVNGDAGTSWEISFPVGNER